MIDLDSNGTRKKNQYRLGNLTQIKSRFKRSESKFVQKRGPNQRIDVHTLSPSMECDHKILVIQFHGVLVQDSMLTPEYEKKSGKDTGVIIESKSEIELPT